MTDLQLMSLARQQRLDAQALIARWEGGERSPELIEALKLADARLEYVETLMRGGHG